MSTERTSTIDFIARGERHGDYEMVLVEQGPWQGTIEDNLRRIQTRLYDCVDAALDGQLSQKFPDAKNVIIQLDCYNVPQAEVREFFDRFAAGIFQTPDYEDALEQSQFIETIEFNVEFDSIH